MTTSMLARGMATCERTKSWWPKRRKTVCRSRHARCTDTIASSSLSSCETLRERRGLPTRTCKTQQAIQRLGSGQQIVFHFPIPKSPTQNWCSTNVAGSRALCTSLPMACVPVGSTGQSARDPNNIHRARHVNRSFRHLTNVHVVEWVGISTTGCTSNLKTF